VELISAVSQSEKLSVRTVMAHVIGRFSLMMLKIAHGIVHPQDPKFSGRHCQFLAAVIFLALKRSRATAGLRDDS